MGFSKLGCALLAVSLACMTGVTFAGFDGNLLRWTPGQSSGPDSPTDPSISPVSLAEDRTQRFLVWEMRIDGNELISTAELLRELPMVYTEPVAEVRPERRDAILQDAIRGSVRSRRCYT